LQSAITKPPERARNKSPRRTFVSPEKGGRTAGHDKRRTIPMLATIAIVLFVLWLLGVVAFKVTAFAIHLLLIAAVVMLVLHFVRGRTA
jgi:hypothetical protein